jgi:hypothetical protein
MLLGTTNPRPFGCHGLPKGKYGVAAARKRSPALPTPKERVLYCRDMEQQCAAAARKCISCLSYAGRDVLQGSFKILGLFGRHVLRTGGTNRRRRSQMRISRELFERDILLGLAETQAFSVVIQDVADGRKCASCLFVLVGMCCGG